MENSKRLRDILATENIEAVSYHYGITYEYLQFTKVFEPYIPIKSIDSLLEKDKEQISISAKRSESFVSNEEVFNDSIARTKSKIRDYVYCNVFDLFVTFTFKNDRQNINRCKQRMNDWLKNQIKRNGKFKYLIVPEFHKDGRSIHFHALFKGYPGKLTEAINPHTGQKLIKKAV